MFIDSRLGVTGTRLFRWNFRKFLSIRLLFKYKRVSTASFVQIIYDTFSRAFFLRFRCNQTVLVALFHRN